jgi:sigma-B regulation protein RsbU (phosphoserine phosphatase)
MSEAPTQPTPLNESNRPGDERLDSSILRVLMEASTDRIYFKDLQSRIVRNNAAHARSLGAKSPDECVGKTDADFFSREHAERAFRDEQEIIRTGQPVIAKLERQTMRDGRKAWASATKMPWRDPAGNIIGTFGITRDVTATKEAEEKLEEERNLLRTIIDHLPSRLYVKDTAARYVLNNKAHLAMLGAKTQADTIGRTTLDFFPGERGRQALADDRQVLETQASILSQEKSDFGSEGRVNWSLVTKVPLLDTRNQLVGLVGISHDITRRKRAEEELQRRSTEMETDLRMARQVQEAFLNRDYPLFPRDASPATTALRFAHRYLPTTSLGGDFFDILQLSDTRCGVLICDVMGHGVRAGLLTALIRGVVEEIGLRADDPAHVLAEVNRSLMPIIEHTGQPVFATVFFGVIDTAEKTLRYGNAGHPPPLLRHAATGLIQRLVPDDPEPAAGLLSDFHYSSGTCPFDAGDLLLGYTDGILEAANGTGTMFGEAPLCRILRETDRLPCAEIGDRVLKEVQQHCGCETFDDDVCLVLIQAAGR